MDLKEHKWYGPRYFIENKDNHLSDMEQNISHGEQPLTFDLVQCRSKKDHYFSVFKFYLDILKACNCGHIIGPASKQQQRKNKLKQLCIFAIQSVFPWFDIQNTAMLDDFFHSKENKMEVLNDNNEHLEHAYAGIRGPKTYLNDFKVLLLSS